MLNDIMDVKIIIFFNYIKEMFKLLINNFLCSCACLGTIKIKEIDELKTY